jgi:hypothetical protein
MEPKQVAILNSLVTYAAENVPGGLSSEETEVAQIVGRWAVDHIPVRPICPHCGDLAPYGEGRIPWLEAHIDSSIHRWWWALRNKPMLLTRMGK